MQKNIVYLSKCKLLNAENEVIMSVYVQVFI